MDEGKANWPVIAGVAAGVLGGILVGSYLYATRFHKEPEAKLQDASDLLERCRESIREMERMKSDLEVLRHPIAES